MKHSAKVRLNPGILFLLAIFQLVQPARAQLANSFLSVTKIETIRLSNAVQIVIHTDGTLQFGGDLNEWIDSSPGKFEPKPTTHFRLRLLNARAKVPAFVNLGAYPADAALVTSGREPFGNPFFYYGQNGDAEPRVDIELRFAAPVLVRRFSVGPYRDLYFTETLGPREVGVVLGDDQQSIVITIIPDRNDAPAAQTIQRSPRAEQKHALRIERTGSVNGVPRFTVLALHTPLAELLDALGQKIGEPFSVAPDVADVDVSLALPVVTVAEFGRTLETAFGLVAAPNASGLAVSREGDLAFERIALNNLSPESARLALPDFLLPSLRADAEGHALWISATPRVAARVRRDLQALDVPRAQVRIEARAWEVSSNEGANIGLRIALGGTVSFDTAINSAVVKLQEDQARGAVVALQALQKRGRARLVANPFLRVISGEKGSLFVGQTRTVTILQNDGGGLSVQALQLPVGTALDVTPTVGAAGDITLSLRPRVSTVDALEDKTGLPTLGLREIESAVRLRSGDTILVAGLDSDIQFASSDKIFPSRRKSLEKTTFLLFVTATIV